MNPEILYEDNEILVCIKPAGIPTQSSRIGVPDMVSILKNHLHNSSVRKTSEKAAPKKSVSGRSFSNQKKQKPSEPYLAVIHRLDQPVEGILVFAKTKNAARSLNQQLTSSGFGKHYLALLDGIPAKEGMLEDYMVKDSRTNMSRICDKNTPGAKFASLSYKVLKSREHTALVQITLNTGRHHQIRVQMAHIGCPLSGDKKYGKASSGSPSRLFLCAYRLTFNHPASKKPMVFEHIPQDFL